MAGPSSTPTYNKWKAEILEEQEFQILFPSTNTRDDADQVKLS